MLATEIFPPITENSVLLSHIWRDDSDVVSTRSAPAICLVRVHSLLPQPIRVHSARSPPMPNLHTHTQLSSYASLMRPLGMPTALSRIVSASIMRRNGSSTGRVFKAAPLAQVVREWPER